jgi:LysM repeat protein
VQLVTVGPGETITAIAAKLGSSAQAIMDANGIDDPFDIPAGTELAVPR